MPIFKDKNTPNPFNEIFEDNPMFRKEGSEDAKPDHVYLDCMCFGMGCCCLQITFQACNITEARYLYDSLAVLCPLMVLLLNLSNSVVFDCCFSSAQGFSIGYGLQMADYFTICR
jgi:hypothetical protein